MFSRVSRARRSARVGAQAFKEGARTGDRAKFAVAAAKFGEAAALDPGCTQYSSMVAHALVCSSELSQDYADLERALKIRIAIVLATAADDRSRPVWLAELGNTQSFWYLRTGDASALDMGISKLAEAEALTRAGHERRDMIVFGLGRALSERFDLRGREEDLQRSITFLREALSIAEDEDYLVTLGGQLLSRYERDADDADFDESVALLERALAVSPDASKHLPLMTMASASIARYRRTNDSADLDRAIDLSGNAVDSYPANSESTTRLRLLAQAAAALSTRFESTNDLVDLDRAIDLELEAVNGLSLDNPARSLAMVNLATSFYRRAALTGEIPSLDTALSLSRDAALLQAGSPPIRARAARLWAEAAVAAQNWNEAATAYTLAVQLAGVLATRDLSASDQEHRLADFAGLGSDAAAACVQAGDIDRAVELFEQGRAVAFAQALEVGDELRDLRQVHPELAQSFERCRASLRIEESPTEAYGGPVAGAADEFELLLGEIRRKPGFGQFLAPPSIHELTAAGSAGPVVMVTVSRWRSDALVVRATGVSVVPLVDVTEAIVYQRVNEYLRALEVVSRGDVRRPEAADAEACITKVLGWLGDAVALPVLDELGYTEPPRKGATWPRVWWCPTGVLSFLPFHAAGRHTALDPPAVIDRVVSSTIPNCRALTRARSARRRSSAVRLLVVAMPTTVGRSHLQGAAREATALRELPLDDVAVLGLPGTPPAQRSHVLSELADRAWVHFACHGESDMTDPSSSHLLLADKPLTVFDLTRLRLRSAEFAFLSACTTARSGTRTPDEPIHLSAAFLLAGFRHVVGSLWPIDDGETSWLVRRFYESLDPMADEPMFAEALHHAVRELRAVNRTRPQAWAPFTHTGP